MPQLILKFIDIPIPETCLWEQLDDDHERTVTETRARFLVKGTVDKQLEQTSDD